MCSLTVGVKLADDGLDDGGPRGDMTSANRHPGDDHKHTNTGKHAPNTHITNSNTKKNFNRLSNIRKCYTGIH